MQEEAQPQPSASRDELVRALGALAHPTRLEILHRLGRPAFAPDLAREFGVTRQTIKKHLVELMGVGLVVARPGRRKALPATEYLTNPAALFAFKENVRSLGIHLDAALLPPTPTRRGSDPSPAGGTAGAGLLLVHGDQPGRWFHLARGTSWVVGRDARDDISLPYDPFASARHALVKRAPEGWVVTDLDSTNGTLVNFRPLPRGGTHRLVPGDVLTIGHSHLILRDGP